MVFRQLCRTTISSLSRNRFSIFYIYVLMKIFIIYIKTFYVKTIWSEPSSNFTIFIYSQMYFLWVLICWISGEKNGQYTISVVGDLSRPCQWIVLSGESIEMKGITRCKLIIISAVCKKFLGQIISYLASL